MRKNKRKRNPTKPLIWYLKNFKDYKIFDNLDEMQKIALFSGFSKLELFEKFDEREGIEYKIIYLKSAKSGSLSLTDINFIIGIIEKPSDHKIELHFADNRIQLENYDFKKDYYLELIQYFRWLLRNDVMGEF